MMEVVDSLVKNNNIPIVDISYMGPVASPVKPWVRKAADRLKKGISEYGLVYIVNHGITDHMLQNGYRVMKKFSDLPEEIRMKHACLSDADQDKILLGGHLHGYVPPSADDRLIRERMEDIRHTYNILHMEDSLGVPEDTVPGFKDTVNDLAEEFRKVATILLQLFAVGLDMNPNCFLSKHKKMLNNGETVINRDCINGLSINETLLRLVFYPPLGDRMIPGLLRSSQRIECGSFTILAQDSEGGLEVFKNNRWQRIGHLPGALLINVGTALEEWTSGTFKALKYRVVIPEQRTIKGRGHYNIAFHVHSEDSMKPVVSHMVPNCDNRFDDNINRTIKWPISLTSITAACENLQTRLNNIDFRRFIRMITRRFNRHRPANPDANNVNSNHMESLMVS